MKTLKIIMTFGAFAVFNLEVAAQKKISEIESPVVIAKLIGDKLIRDTPFKYELAVLKNSHVFNGMQTLDFGRTFSIGKPAVAYAYTTLDAPNDMALNVNLEHNDGCKIWLNGKLVYQRKGDKKINLFYDERSIEMPEKCLLNLKKGKNNLLIKSETKGNEWKVYIKPPSLKGSVTENAVYPKIGLSNVLNISESINKISNWLVIGPFENPKKGKDRVGIDITYTPEKEVQFGQMYQGLDRQITWTIPKIEIVGQMINPSIWGTNYDWNYHNGGVAWAMQQLSEITGEKKYDDYATNFGDFHLKGIPFVKYQLETLSADSSANIQIVNTKLLDFALAPSLPLIYKLRKNPNFNNRQKYVDFVGRMLKYARYDQLRYPEKHFYTRTTPEKYTTWVDDMFMGIPFLVQASQYVEDVDSRRFFINDAATQVLEFKDQVWDADAELYVHAKYSQRDVKLPHWSRANGWAIWAITDVLTYLPVDDPKYKPIMALYLKHINSLVRFQNKNGFWTNVLDQPDSKEEVSGTAIFTMAIARGIKNGWLDKNVYKINAINGWNAIKTKIELDGTVHDICMGSMCSEDVNYYMNRPFLDNDTHGLFTVLFAAIAMSEIVN